MRAACVFQRSTQLRPVFIMRMHCICVAQEGRTRDGARSDHARVVLCGVHVVKQGAGQLLDGFQVSRFFGRELHAERTLKGQRQQNLLDVG